MTARFHQKSTEILSDFAQAFRVDVNSHDEDRWSAALVAAKALDSIVDDDHIYNSGWYYEQLIQGATIPHMTDDEAGYVRSVFASMEDESQQRWQTSASRLGTFALRRIHAETTREYIEAVRDESAIMADVLRMENTSDLPDHAERDSFNGWMQKMARGAYALDTFTDIIKDSNEGNVHLNVTPRVIGELGKYALQDLAELARATPASVYPTLLHSLGVKIAEKIRQPDSWSKHLQWKKMRIT